MTPFYQTKNEFNVRDDKSFLVLPDGKSIVGVNPKTPNASKSLVIEDVKTGKVASFGRHKGDIKTLLYHKGTASLFAGDSSGRIAQYRRSSRDSNFTLLKDYRDVGITGVYSSAQVGRFAVFGCRNRVLVVIDIPERRLCEGQIQSPFYQTLSLQVCRGLGNKVYLSVGGYDPRYYSDVSDFLDVTEMYNYKKEFGEYTEKQMQSSKKK